MDTKTFALTTWDICSQNESWFPTLHMVLEVDLETASWKPDMPGMNSIQEIGRHLLYYKARFLSRLQDTDFELLPTNEATFSAFPELSWSEVKEKIHALDTEIPAIAGNLSDHEMNQVKPKETIARQILDLATHDAYHAGQILLLRKLQGAW